MPAFNEEQLQMIREHGADPAEVRKDLDEIHTLHDHLTKALKECGVGSSPSVFSIAIGTVIAETVHASVAANALSAGEADDLLSTVLGIATESAGHMFKKRQAATIPSPTSNTKH